MKHVLYVEDDDVSWEVTQSSLPDDHWAVRATNSREACELLKSRQFDIILMDIRLEGSDLDGIHLTRILKGTFQGTPPDYTAGIKKYDAPIIFVTAYSALYSRDELLESGGDEVVTKPVDFTRLSLAMSRLMLKNVAQTQSAEKLDSDRRLHPRYDAENHCHIAYGNRILVGHTNDLSIGGARVTLDNPDSHNVINIGTPCTVNFDTSNGVVEARCTVLRITNEHPFEIALFFTTLEQASRSRLEAYLKNQS